MSLFSNPLDQERVLNVLKAYVEEWGAENVEVWLPARWRPHVGNYGGPASLRYGTENVVSIRVNSGSVHLQFDARIEESRYESG